MVEDGLAGKAQGGTTATATATLAAVAEGVTEECDVIGR